jgi:hypothetical protein
MEEWGMVRKAAPDGKRSEDSYELVPLLSGDSRVEEAQARGELRNWAELHVFDCPEFLDLLQQHRAILKLFSTGKTCRDIGNELGIGKSTAANLFHGAIKNMQKRIETARREGRESPQLASIILAVVNGDGEGDNHAPKAKGWRISRNLTLPGASRLRGHWRNGTVSRERAGRRGQRRLCRPHA